MALSKDKITDENGDVFIAKARVILVDHVRNNMAVSRVKRQKICNNPDELNNATEDNVKAVDRFWRTLKISRPISMTAVPLDARQVDSIDANNTESIIHALSKAVMQQAIQQEMVQQQIRQAQEEAEMMEEVQSDMDKLAQTQKEQSEQNKQSPAAQRTAYTTLKTSLIEKRAKLDSSIVRLRSDLSQPDMDVSLLEGEDLVKTREAAGSITFSWAQLVSLPSQVRSPALPSLPCPVWSLELYRTMLQTHSPPRPCSGTVQGGERWDMVASARGERHVGRRGGGRAT